MKTRKIVLLIFFLTILVGMTGILSVGATTMERPAQQAYQAGSAQTYVVLYKANAVPANAAKVAANAGGSLVYSYDKIGVAIARSDNELFRNENQITYAFAIASPGTAR